MRPKVVVAGADWCGDVLLACARGFASVGADVAVVPTNVPDQHGLRLKELAKWGGRLPWLGPRVMEKAERVGFKRLFDAVRWNLNAVLGEWRPQVLVALVDGHYPINPDLLAQHERVFKVGWMLDDPFTFFGPWSRGIHVFDALYTVEDSAVHSLRMATGKPVRTLPLAADPAIYRPLDTRPDDRECPVTFVGKSYGHTPAGLARAALLARVRHLGLAIWGDAGWKAKLSPNAIDLSACYKGGPIPPDKCNAVYNKSTVTLNVNHPQIRMGTSLRTFAIGAAGAFQLVDWRPGLDDLLEPGREVVSYRTEDELAELAERYVADSIGRGRIAAAGRARVLASHTYAHRAREILRDGGLAADDRQGSAGRGQLIWQGPAPTPAAFGTLAVAGPSLARTALAS